MSDVAIEKSQRFAISFLDQLKAGNGGSPNIWRLHLGNGCPDGE
jgi:hypothetical protein